MEQKQGHWQLYEECSVHTKNAPLRLNWHQTALAIVGLHFSEGTSQSITHWVNRQLIIISRVMPYPYTMMVQFAILYSTKTIVFILVCDSLSLRNWENTEAKYTLFNVTHVMAVQMLHQWYNLFSGSKGRHLQFKVAVAVKEHSIHPHVPGINFELPSGCHNY